MANTIKYSESAQTLALKKGNFFIGTGDVGKGPTETTGYYNGITPPSGGYTIYLNKASQGPSIYVASSDDELINITNRITGTSYTTVNECFNYYASQSDKMVLDKDYSSVVTSGLVFNLDADFLPSYPRNGTTWYDLSSGGNNGTLVNSPVFTNSSIVFDGINDYINLSTNIQSGYTQATYEFVCMPTSLPSPGDYKQLYIQENSTWIALYNVGSGAFFGIDLANGSGWFDNNGGSNTNARTTSTIEVNKYYHVVYSWDGNNVRVYLNGVLHNTASTLQASNGRQNVTTLGPGSSHRNIGSRYSGSGNNWIGNMNIVKFYNISISASEILQNYYGGNIVTSGLVFSLDASNIVSYPKTGTVWTDMTGNENNGTLINGPTYNSTNGGSINFDGSDDYINIPNTTSLQVTGDQTLVFWVYPQRRDRRQNFYNKAYGGEGTITYEPDGSMYYFWGTAGSDAFPYQGVGTYGAPMLTLNIWYFVVLVRELSTPSKTVKWYINGVLNSTTTAAYTSATAGTSPITIGKGYAGSFLGKIGLVSQYNRALSQSEITQNFNATRSRFGI